MSARIAVNLAGTTRGVTAHSEQRDLGSPFDTTTLPSSEVATDTSATGKGHYVVGVLFQISAYMPVMCLHVAESLVDRRWSSGLSGSGTVEC